FGTICIFQMVCEIVKISLSTAFSLIPADVAPSPSSLTSIAVTVTCEVFYFSSCHVLFALHRLIVIVFPQWKAVWEKSTPFAIAFCVILAMFKAYLPQYLDPNLYLMFDRDWISWFFTDSPQTGLNVRSARGFSIRDFSLFFSLKM
ncbi:hypothetical protein PENTCL1PPCAC_16487, partial [Pristionchus entomophagus]